MIKHSIALKLGGVNGCKLYLAFHMQATSGQIVTCWATLAILPFRNRAISRVATSVNARIFDLFPLVVHAPETKLEWRTIPERQVKEIEPFDLPMFSGLPAEKIAALVRSASVAHVDAGAGILTEGERGREMYVIQSGAIQVYTKGFNGDHIVLARLEPGQWFGEQALLTEETGRRNASVRA